MLCPHCTQPIPAAAIIREAAAIAGRKSRRTLTPEQARVMVAARKRRRADVTLVAGTPPKEVSDV